MNPKISVIIPVYKVESYLRQCLDSVVNQTYHNLQILLVDDGSPDNSGAICDEYASRDDRIVVIHKNNGGVSSARNAGINAATGEWIYFVDADDQIEPETLEICIQKAIKANVDLVLFELDQFDKKKHFTPLLPKAPKSDHDILYDDLNDLNSFARFISWGSMCICLEKASSVKGRLSFNETISVAEDTEFKLKLYQCIDSFLYTPLVLYHYRVTPNSASTNRDVLSLFYSRAAAHTAIREAIIAGEYPADVLKLEDRRAFEAFVRVLTVNLFGSASLGYAQKREIIFTVINTDVFKSVSSELDQHFLDIRANIFFRLKRCPIFAVYFIHALKEMLDGIRTIRSRLKGRSANAKTKDTKSK